ncbi:hypothetical protein [Paenibacillus sp. NAIST15-1]|uniref:hypothetical protein n=1 Tax=Paenibacillus sp. NAIST15-1 TaxID=1605994 RepID=UPI0008685B00|nr:hypothetical protein [Paenibacillus sp. NAIST15-1]GAV11504.1 hypothetical protein PBN151_1433 [Paenibacillus sp. NAIST15-1]
MDRFEFGVPDINEAKVLLKCSESGYEIYEGNTYIETPEGEAIIDDLEIVMRKYGLIRKTAGEINN